MSYLLRHNPENLPMDAYGYVEVSRFVEKLNERFRIGRELVVEIVEKGDAKRFELVNGKIRALYGHTLPIRVSFGEDKTTRVFYHGTTLAAAQKILKLGLKPMKREWVHLSPTIQDARRVGLRRTVHPLVLQINAEGARREGVRFYRASDKVCLSLAIPPKHIGILET
jgi:putative RNA 2'-phosphotransferase